MNQVYAQNNIIDVPIGLQNAKPQYRLQPDMFKLPQKHFEASPLLHDPQDRPSKYRANQFSKARQIKEEVGKQSNCSKE